MARSPHQGRFRPTHPEKYVGDVTNIIYRSGLEFKVMRYFDRTTSIMRWSSEEVHIPYVSPVDGQQHRYFPDFLIVMKHVDGSTRKVLIEVKPESQCKPPSPPKTQRQRQVRRFLEESATWNVNQAKWAAAKAWCERHGCQFLILNEKHILGE